MCNEETRFDEEVMKRHIILKYCRYIGCCLLLWCLGIQHGRTQTVDDLILVEPGNFKLCNNDVMGQTIEIYNQCTHPAFANGKFKVNWGDGSAMENWGTDEKMSHTYMLFGIFDLVFSWQSNDGSKNLSKTYKVMRLKKPIVALKEGDAGNTCNNVEAEIKLIDFDLQTEGTKYFIDFGDGDTETFTQKQVAEDYNGIIKHMFSTEECPLIVKMRVENECPGLIWETTFNTSVVVPPKALFEFIGTACTGYPVGIRNISKEGKNIQCDESTDYIWKIDNLPSQFTKHPNVSFDTPGEHEIRLIAWTNNLECSRDTMIKKVTVVESPKVQFTVDRDVICSGETVRVTDNSLGEDVEYTWTVNGDPVNAFSFVNGTTPTSVNPVIRLDGYGKYTIQLSLKNNCPGSTDNTIVTVMKDPEIYVKTWPDSICGTNGLEVQTVDMERYIDIYWNGNEPNPVWKIEALPGMAGTVEYEAGFGPDSEYPRVKLKVGSTYSVSVLLGAVAVDGVECGDASKRAFTRTLKVKDPKIVADIVPDKIPGADGKITICSGEQVVFTNHSTGEYLRHRWSVAPAGNYDPFWEVKNLTGDETVASPTFQFIGYGDYIVTDNMSVDCNGKPVSFNVHVKKDPEVFMTNFPAELCPRDMLNAGVCIFYNWYNNEQKVHWEFVPNTVDFLNGTSANSPEPQVHFRTSEKYSYTATVQGASCPQADTVIHGETRVRIAGLDATVREKNNRSDACEGEMLVFTNLASERDPEGTELRYSWEVSVPLTVGSQGGTPDDCKFLNDKKDDKVAAITFRSWGTYDVKATVVGFCDTLSSTLRIRIKKNPEVSLEAVAHCPGELVLADEAAYKWWNNTPAVSWEIKRQDGLDQPGDYVAAGDMLTQLYPRVDFRRPGKYLVKAKLNHAGCPATDPESEVEYWIYDPAVYGEVKLKSPLPDDPLKADVCENEIVGFENTMTEEAGLLKWKWEVESAVADGWRFVEGDIVLSLEEGEVKKAPSIQFLKYGEYKVKVTTFSTCNAPAVKEFTVVVRGIPEIVLQPDMEKICADWKLELKDRYLQYVDKKNNDLVYEWSVVADRVVTPPVFDATAEFPEFDFRGENAHYTVTLKAYSKCAPGGVQTFTSDVDVIAVHKKSVFTTDSIGCTDFGLVLDNRSEGDSLGYTWTVTPENSSGAGWQFTSGDEHAQKPQLKITEAGFYTVALKVDNICGSDVSDFKVRAYSVPEIQIADIAGVCEPLAFAGNDRVTINENNDRIREVKWEITALPGSVSEGYEFINGTTVHSAYPDIIFKACNYEVVVEYKNRCPEPGRRTFTVKVDKFIPIEPLADKSLCVRTDPFRLEALPAGGEWTLKDGSIPDAAKILYRDGEGRDWFNPELDPYFEGDIELVYSKANFSCVAHDTMKVHVFPLPHVEAGGYLDMCINHEPFLLENGTPQNGFWTLEDGTILAGDLFPPSAAGDFKLKYYFKDDNTCVNVDSTVMSVHPLPETGFGVQALNCIRTEVTITPRQLDGNRFEWDFGDGSAKVVTEGNAVHVYDDFGFRKISNVTTSKFGCVDRSDSVQIEIVNIPPPALFEVDPLEGCARFGVEPGNENAVLKVEFSLDTTVYRDNHNYLSFRWDYGDETNSGELLPHSPKYYPSGAWDTTYLARFTVSNMCGTQDFERVITVLSAPKVKFALKHEWECSPVLLELQNTTTGNNVTFDWTFENARTGEVVKKTDVRNPVHEFSTDSASTTFYITLKATNACDDDAFTDSLVVKPRTISAHFTPAKREICVGEEICFRNNSTDTLTSIENTYWNFGDGIKDTVWSPCHAYDVAQDYVVSLLIDNGCGYHSVTDTLTVRPLPQLELLSEDHLCEDNAFTFVVHSDQELKFVSWDFGDGKTGSRDSLQHLYKGYGKYAVTVEGISARTASCKSTRTKEIEIYNKPIVSIVPLDTIQCSPLYYKPEITGEAFFEWDFGDGSKLSTSGEHLYENPTDTIQKFSVVAYAQTDKGCKSEYYGNVTLYNLPRAIVDKSVVKGRPEKVTFLNRTVNGTDGFWELPFRGVVYSQEDQEVEFMENGVYPVKYVAESYYGCRDTLEVEHVVEMKGLFFPNTFIPQSSNGKVSHFNGIAIGLKEYWLEIYDFYGNKIWETKALEDGKPSEGWDGRSAKGEPMPQGTYTWRARAIFINDNVWNGKNNDSGIRETVQGTVLLLRE